MWKCRSMGVWESVCNDFSMAVTTTVENAVASVIVSVCDIGTSCEDSGRQTIDDANRRESTEIDRRRRELGRFQSIDVDSCRFLSPSDPREARCMLGLPANSTPGREANKVKSGALGDRAPPRGGRAVGATECGALGDRAPPSRRTRRRRGRMRRARLVLRSFGEAGRSRPTFEAVAPAAPGACRRAGCIALCTTV